MYYGRLHTVMFKEILVWKNTAVLLIFAMYFLYDSLSLEHWLSSNIKLCRFYINPIHH